MNYVLNVGKLFAKLLELIHKKEEEEEERTRNNIGEEDKAQCSDKHCALFYLGLSPDPHRRRSVLNLRQYSLAT